MTVIDDLSSGQRINANLLQSKGVVFIEGDILTVKDFPKVDLIYHLACPASPPFYQKDPVRTWKISVLGTLRVAEWASEIHARLVFTSTSEVYGDPLEHPQKETYWGNVNPIGIRSCYDEGKRAAETLLMDMNRAGRLNVGIARLFNTYGPHMDPKDGRVVSNLILQALKNEPMTVYGDGKQTRSFCYVDDTVEGLMALMSSSQVGPINIGNPEERTIIEAAHVIQHVTGRKMEVVHLPLPKDDPTRRRPDITKAKELLGWSPKTSYEEGLKRTVEYFKTTL